LSIAQGNLGGEWETMSSTSKKKPQPDKPDKPGVFKIPEDLPTQDLGDGIVWNEVPSRGIGKSLWIPEISNIVFDTDLLSTFRTFEDETVELRKRVDEQTRALRDEKTSAKQKEQKIATLETTLEELRSKEKINFLLSRVNQAAQRQLLGSEDFRKRFLDTRECLAFVMAVDIRRSTELMLKARTPEAFAAFITTLCVDLMNIITENFGVFDKFTGDGVLAFFPDFFSGDDAAYYTVAAADRCHASFNEHYQKFRRSFSSVLTGIGLGIGIDYGTVHLVQMAGGLTVVGGPVVYACRLSGAPPGSTLVNQPAYEVISDKFGATCFVSETNVDIKHEGGMLAYEVRLNGREYDPRTPPWRAEGEARERGDTTAAT
jgi:class 3 adenylate cyclase